MGANWFSVCITPSKRWRMMFTDVDGLLSSERVPPSVLVSYSISLKSSVAAFTSLDGHETHIFSIFHFQKTLDIASDDIWYTNYHLSGLNGFYALLILFCNSEALSMSFFFSSNFSFCSYLSQRSENSFILHAALSNHQRLRSVFFWMTPATSIICQIWYPADQVVENRRHQWRFISDV